jgi:universal stress protein A
MSKIRRMLIPTDFSPLSDIAFTYGLDMASREGSRLELLHVIDEASFATAYPDGFYIERPGLRAQILDEANRQLAALVARCGAQGVPATTEVLVGRAAPMIVQEAMKRGTDLIVMGTHGRSGFAHLFLGSVAEKVVRSAPCPVLTVRQNLRLQSVPAKHAAVRQEPLAAPLP